MKVSVSFLCSDYDQEETIKRIDESKADYIHVDMMDGNFVEASNFGPQEIKKMFKNTTKPLDVHMMVSSPNKYVKDFAKMKNDVINMIRHTSMKVGLAINPETKVSRIIPLLNHVDQVLVMSVKPGKGGQKFMEDVLYKVETLKDIREQNNYHYIISIDGGINNETAVLCKEAGVDMVVSGSYVCKSDNYDERIDKLK